MQGKIQQWNTEKGYGFIQIANSEKCIFAHISAFVQKQPLPQIGEMVSFDTATNPEGKMAAKNVRYLNRPISEHKQQVGRTKQRKKQPEKENGLMGIISAGIGVVVAGLIGYQIYQFAVAKLTPKQENKPIQFTETPSKTTTAQYQCDGRQHCSQMTSCEEAKFFVRNCTNTKMDGDGDGIPCEGQGNLCGY